MSRAALALALAVACASVALLACKKPSPSGGGNGSATARGDGGPATSDGRDPEEADVRAGKRTGLGAPDETPEVATEPLARALVRRDVPWSRVVDPARGVAELRSIPASDQAAADDSVEHRCGAALDQALAAFATGVTATLDAPGLVYDIQCDNIGLSVTIPGVESHAVCTVSSPAGDGLEYDLVFVPDDRLGLRLIGLATAHAVTTPDELRDRFDELLGRYGARCP
jgi:hypothetical protein